MIDHVGFGISDFAASKAFYVAALKPLGFSIMGEGSDWAMIGKDGATRFWFGVHPPAATPIHLAFSAATRHEVDAFYDAAIAAGGRDNGKPGLRPNYHANYYGRLHFFDPDGHNIEAVCHTPI